MHSDHRNPYSDRQGSRIANRVRYKFSRVPNPRGSSWSPEAHNRRIKTWGNRTNWLKIITGNNLLLPNPIITNTSKVGTSIGIILSLLVVMVLIVILGRIHQIYKISAAAAGDGLQRRRRHQIMCSWRRGQIHYLLVHKLWHIHHLKK